MNRPLLFTFLRSRRKPLCACLMVSLMLAAGQAARSQLATPDPAAVTDRSIAGPTKFSLLLRDEENWTGLRNNSSPRENLERWKYVPVRASDPNSFVSSGGEVREWFEHFDNEGWGTIPAGDNYLLQRYMLHSDLHFSSHVRMFFQLKSGIENGRKVGPRPYDEDRLDFNQGYLDLNFGIRPDTATEIAAAAETGTPSGNDLHPVAILRLGRQELNFGSGRLISVSEGVNVRFGFDAARVILQPARWRIDGFFAKPDAYRPGVFDDIETASQTLSGVYATTPLRQGSSASIDLYGLISDFRLATYVQGAGRDHRETLGTRVFNIRPASKWNYDVESTLQVGSFKPALAPLRGNVRAWAISPFVSYGFLHSRLAPRVVMNAGITSGDKDPAAGKLQSFAALFPRGDYFGKSKQIGPVNVISMQPEVSLTLARKVSAVLDTNFLWRESTADGLYAASGMPLRSAGGPGGSSARYVGCAPEAEIVWQASKHTSFDLTGQRYLVGAYLRRQPPGGSDLSYLAAYITVKF